MLIYLPIAEVPVDVFMILGMSAAVGFISGMFGVGGGFLMTPLLIFSGIPPAIAVATEASQIAASGTTGALGAWRRRAVDLKLALVLVTGGTIGTFLGVTLFNQLKTVGQLDLFIQLAYLVLLVGVGGMMLAESLRAILLPRRAVQPLSARKRRFAALPLRMRFETSGFEQSILPILALGTIIGILGAVLGIGGGFLLVPAMIYLLRVPAAVVVGTSQVQIVVTMIIATLLHAVTNQSVDIILALLLILGGVFGAQFGARIGRRLKGEHFRLLLALIVLSVGLRFAYELVVTPETMFSIVVEGAR